MHTLQRTSQKHHGGHPSDHLHGKTQIPERLFLKNMPLNHQSPEVNHLVLRVQAVYDAVFSQSSPAVLRGLGSSHGVRIPKTYTSLADKLPNIHSTAAWSETVIRSMFDTLVPLSPEYQNNCGSPADSIVNIVQRERHENKKELAFGLLLAELAELETLLLGLDLLDQHKQSIHMTIGRIRKISK